MIKIQPEDWQDEVVARFWEYSSVRPQKRLLYFSRQAGDGLALFLHLRGVLSGRLLDFGCGPGYLFEHLASYPVECWGTDQSPKSIAEVEARCRALTNFRGACLIGELEPFFNGLTFDVVTCVETIEHVQQKETDRLVLSLRRWLKPGGTLVITTPHDEQLDEATAYCPFCDREYHMMQHVRSFGASELKAILEGNGLSVEFCQGIDLGRFCDDARNPTGPPGAPGRSIWERLWSRLRRAISNRKAPCESSADRLARLMVPGRHLVALAKRRESESQTVFPNTPSSVG
jgi:2-polyprenyl-3-methyl-5-hydroxy-6-metoxy-1,4-benzoquinol methylase